MNKIIICLIFFGSSLTVSDVCTWISDLEAISIVSSKINSSRNSLLLLLSGVNREFSSSKDSVTAFWVLSIVSK